MAKTHWWHNLSDEVKDWLATNPREPLPTEVFDAVIGAGGIPRRRDPGADGLPDAPLLSDEDWEYCKEAARAERRT